MTNYQERIKRNNDYYDFFAPKVKVRSEDRDFSKAMKLFFGMINSEGVILDIGCGAGNHLKTFKEHGFKSLGIEPSKEMRDLASQEGEVIDGSFETLLELELPLVSGVWCASSLLHVPTEDISSVFKNIATILSKDNPFYFTVRLGEGSKWDKWDDAEGDISRFIQLFSEDELLSNLREAGFRKIDHWLEDSYWGRPSKWISVIAQK